MAYFFKIWHERLFFLERKNAGLKKSDLPIEFIEITDENTELVTLLRGKEFVSQFKRQLSMGDFGLFACLDGKPVGCGWVKHTGSRDYFYRISDGACYLCRFFVNEDVRGHNIYPELISELIKHEKDCKSFYIGVEKGNIASEKGLSKVGFKFLKEYDFVRALKFTVNKKRIY